VLKAVTMFPEGHGSAAGFRMYQEMLNEAAKGEVILEFAGGPEAIPGFEQPEAVRTGAIDVNFTVTAYYKTMLPEANGHHLSRLTPWEERESGFYDLMVELHKAKNIYYLGRQLVNSPFIMSTRNLRIERPYDLSGLRFRTAALYDALYRKLGITGVTMPLGDQYSALERGLVDGTASTPSSAIKFSLYEVAKYVIGPRFYGAQNAVMLINLDVWNQLPKDVQDLMIDVQIKVEPEIWDYFGDTLSKDLKKLQDEGMEFVEWSPADTKWFLDTADKAAWEEIEENIGPEMTAKLRSLTTK